MDNILNAKNSFEGGLVMDFSPEMSPATTLSSALNATLITYNGNEMALQNDMGNGRVETAFLPEGYVPVGTCEFGDIIYIVSYNPLTNKSLIGCFPSPERNISTDEQGLPNQSIEASDFQEIGTDNKPTGVIKSMSKKLILTNTLSPGDKYTIYSDKEILNEKLSGLGAGSIDEFPQILKVHVVSFEDDGKIKHLDSSVKWYDQYFIANKKEDLDSADIDSYRNLLQSGYSVFLSKVSGKLGLYFELESIEGFSCSYDVEVLENKEIDGVIYKRYKTYLIYDWITNNRFVNPSCLVILNSVFKNVSSNFDEDKLIDKKFEEIAIKNSYLNGISDYTLYKNVKENYDNYESETFCDIKVNRDRQSIISEFNTFNIPYIINGSEIKTDITYTFETIPTMPYGILKQFSLKNTIEFDKIGKKDISISEWRYYNTETLSTLTLGLNIYTEPHYKVNQVGLSFYDNEGYKGTHLISNKKSYSGKFTEIIPLNNSIPSYKLVGYYNREGRFEKADKDYDPNILNTIDNIFVQLNKVDNSLFNSCNKYSNTYILLSDYRKVLVELLQKEKEKNPELDESAWKMEFAEENLVLNSNNNYYYLPTNALIESNKLYLVKINIEYEHESNGNSNTHVQLYKWFWTNDMFNEKYYEELNFSNLKPILQFNCNASYQGNILQPIEETEENIIKLEIKDYIIENSVLVGFLNNYSTFNLYHERDEEGKFVYDENGVENKGALDTINITISIPDKGIIKYDPENFEYKSFNGSLYNDVESLYPEYNEIFNTETENKDLFKIEFQDYNGENSTIEYISSKEEYANDYCKQIKLKFKDIYYKPDGGQNIKLKLNLEKYNKISKIMTLNQNLLTVIKPIIYNLTDLKNYNIDYYNGHFYINDLYVIAGQLNKTWLTRISTLHFNEGKVRKNLIGDTNYSYKYSIPKNSWGYGYNHYNILSGDNKLLTNTQDGFYLWAIDNHEQNLLTDSVSEMIIMNDNLDYNGTYTFSKYTNDKKPLYTYKDRLITWPISPNLHYHNSPYENYVYDFLKTNTKGASVVDTNYTMFGLALVQNSIWYTLNNVFNLNYDTDNFLQTIKYRGNLYKIKEDIKYIINDLGNEFDYINEKNDQPGYIEVQKVGNELTLYSKDKYILVDDNIYKFLEDIFVNKIITSGNFLKYTINHKYNDSGEDVVKKDVEVISSLEVNAYFDEKEIVLTITKSGTNYTLNDEVISTESLKLSENANCVILPEKIIILQDGSFTFDENTTSYNMYIKCEDEIKIESFHIVDNITEDQYNNYPGTPGDAIVALLNNIYIKTNSQETSNISVHSDTIYLDYVTLFTKDIIYLVSIEEDIRKSICINDILYSTYLKDVIGDNKEVSDNDTNLDIQIDSCKITIPVTFKIEKPKLSIPLNNINSNCIIFSEGKSIPILTSVEDGVMYSYIDEKLNPILGVFNYNINPEFINNSYIKTNGNNSLNIENINKAFKIENGKFSINTDFHSDDLFLILLDDMKNGKSIGIRDIHKRISLFKGTEII